MATPTRNLIAALATALLSAACAEAPAATPERAAAATATVIPDAPAEAITVADLTRTSAATTWRATVNGKTYDCSADELLRLPDCRQSS